MTHPLLAIVSKHRPPQEEPSCGWEYSGFPLTPDWNTLEMGENYLVQSKSFSPNSLQLRNGWFREARPKLEQGNWRLTGWGWVTMSAPLPPGRQGYWGIAIRQALVLCSAAPPPQALLIFRATLSYKHAIISPAPRPGPTQQRISSAFKTLQKRPHTPTQPSFQGPHSSPHPPAHPQKSFSGPVLNSATQKPLSLILRNDPKNLWFVSKSRFFSEP